MVLTPNFRNSLQALGKSERDQAQALDMPVRTIRNYKSGRLPIQITRLMRQPLLLRALADDAEQQQAQEARSEVTSE
jgi:hypothetical protein